jgi:hypothetical protein
LGALCRVSQFNPLISLRWCTSSGTAIPAEAGEIFHPAQNGGNGDAGSASGSLVRQNRRQAILGASKASDPSASEDEEQAKHVPSNPSGTAIPLRAGI